MAVQQRPFHVVVWGSTGVVGRLVAEHLARDYQKQGVKWALAGRNASRMEEIRADLARFDSTVKEVPILTADLNDKESLRELTKKAKVILTTVGPYAVSGTPMVEACVATSTHYCDITGEIPWVRRMIDRFDEEAKSKGIRIVHMAGFDSVPSDLGVFLVADHMKKQHNKPCGKVELLFRSFEGVMGGGTVASLFGLFDETGPEKKAVSDPYGLDPRDSDRGPDTEDSLLPGYSNLHSAWHYPFLMAPVNMRVVRRSNALLGHAYGLGAGKNFSYLEAQKSLSRMGAYFASTVYAFIGLLLNLKLLRSLWTRLLPQPGAMPDRKKLENGKWSATVVGQSDELSGQPPVIVKAIVKATGDPAFLTTARMLLESGLCIALEEDELNASHSLKAGVLTPAAAFGHLLVKRLNKCKDMFQFKIIEP